MLDIQALERQVTERMTAHRIPGLALAVIHQGEILYANGFGVTSVEEGGQPVTSRTLFRVGSVSKPLTGTVIMRLVDQGLLELDRPITEYVPWIRFSEEGAARRVTLRMLLSHTSGLSSVANAFGSRDPGALEAMVREVIPALPLEAPPGKVYAYSNPGLSLAAYVASLVAGKDFEQLMQEQLFRPLGMERSTFDPLLALSYPVALPHEPGPDGQLRVLRPFADNASFHPAGFAMTTVLDLVNFALLHMNRGRSGEQQLLSPGAVEAMHTLQASHYRADGGGYGLTFFTGVYKGQKQVYHGGGIHTYQASLDMLPETQTAVLFMANRVYPPGVMKRLIEGTFDQLLDLPAEAPEAAVAASEPNRVLWPAYTGTYVCKFAGLARVAEADGRLMLDYEGQTQALQPNANGTYSLQTERAGAVGVGFVAEADGPCQYMMIGNALLKRIELDPAYALPPEMLAAAAGTYYNVHNGARGAVLRAADDGRLRVSFGWADWQETPCTPLNSPTRFASRWGTFDLAEGVLTINGWRMAKGEA